MVILCSVGLTKLKDMLGIDGNTQPGRVLVKATEVIQKSQKS